MKTAVVMMAAVVCFGGLVLGEEGQIEVKVNVEYELGGDAQFVLNLARDLGLPAVKEACLLDVLAKCQGVYKFWEKEGRLFASFQMLESSLKDRSIIDGVRSNEDLAKGPERPITLSIDRAAAIQAAKALAILAASIKLE